MKTVNKGLWAQKQITRGYRYTLAKHLVTTTRQIAALHCLPAAGHGGHENDVVCWNHSCLLVTEPGASRLCEWTGFLFFLEGICIVDTFHPHGLKSTRSSLCSTHPFILFSCGSLLLFCPQALTKAFFPDVMASCCFVLSENICYGSLIKKIQLFPLDSYQKNLLECLFSLHVR